MKRELSGKLKPYHTPIFLQDSSRYTLTTQKLHIELPQLTSRTPPSLIHTQCAAAFLPCARIVANINYAVTAGFYICIITVSARQREGKLGLALMEKNVEQTRGRGCPGALPWPP